MKQNREDTESGIAGNTKYVFLSNTPQYESCICKVLFDREQEPFIL